MRVAFAPDLAHGAIASSNAHRTRAKRHRGRTTRSVSDESVADRTPSQRESTSRNVVTSNEDDAQAVNRASNAVEPAECRVTRDLGRAVSAKEGWRRLARATRESRRDVERSGESRNESGCVRFVIDVPRGDACLDWVREASGRAGEGAPAFYWSPRARTASGGGKASGRTRDGSVEGDGRASRHDGMLSSDRGARAGLGACATWTDAGEEDESSFQRRIASMRRFLSGHQSGRAGARVYGAGRFDPGRTPEAEWASFGTHFFFLPVLEVVEGVKCATLSVCVAWDAKGDENCGPSAKSFVQALDDACEMLKRSMSVNLSSNETLPPGAAHVTDRTLVPDENGWSKDVSSVIDRIRASKASSSSNREKGEAWVDLGSSFDEADSPNVRSALESLGRAVGLEAPSAVLDQFEAMTMARSLSDENVNSDGMVDAMLLGGKSMEPLRKVVLARRSKLALSAPVNTFDLISRLQARDPDAYQFVLRHPNGETFLGSTPERLFLSQGGRASSEAVAGTRARGSDDGEDAALAYDMLLSPKEHEEFAIVREEVRRALGEVAEGGNDGVDVELEKGILRNVTVQHLYSRLSAPLAGGKNEADLICALHPTPAVCGYPRPAALRTLRAVESFDRGLYSGPLGWIGAEDAEFAVAIRSALVHPSGDEVSLYAGVGVVGSANAQAEWSELNLKTKPLESLLAPAPRLASLPNPNAAWATILVGELVRGGITTFCVAPGSRSTPLALAAEKHVGANVVVCIDERSLGFYALGYAKGSGQPAAVICSSGTAVANLLPSVVEASESSTPLLLLTADRPYELRNTGANQTIDQVKIFGSYTRFNADLAPPGDGSPARACATMASTALRHLRGVDSGPVHLNCAFREPLGPQRVEWDSVTALKGLENWEASSTQFTIGNASISAPQDGSAWQSALSRISRAKRGLFVVGGGTTAADAIAATAMAETLGWAVAADATSGMRVGACENASVRMIPMIDYVLVEPSTHEVLRPDVIVQVGTRLTSKRLNQFLETSAIDHGAEWIIIEPTPNRHDPAHCVSVRVESSIGHASELLERALNDESGYAMSERKAACVAFADRAVSIGDAVAREAAVALDDITINEGVSEMAVAVAISEGLPDSMGLFLGNSMPIRDIDTFAGIKRYAEGFEKSDGTSLGVPVSANRGASGIDGVISTAAGYAAGLGHPVTLIIGDVSFQHDSNGLLFLRERPGQPPVTVVVVNNGGGGIFSFLPVAAQVDDSSFNRLFATPPDVSRRGLCEAHRVTYSHPRTIEELRRALRTSWTENQHNVIEVTTSRARNLVQHKMVQRRCAHAARRALRLSAESTAKIVRGVEIASFSIPLNKPTTTVSASMQREGMILKVTLSDGSVGFGECSPLPGLHRETLQESRAQLAVVASLLDNVDVPTNISLLNGAFTSWLESRVGIRTPNGELFPSVRFAVEAAVANALAASVGEPLAHIMTGNADTNGVFVNGLVDAATDIDAARREARDLVDAGFTCLKVKVARGVGKEGANADAERLAAIRAEIGPSVVLRADANKGWDLNDALHFGARVVDLGVNLQYVEEPTRDARDIATFHFTTSIPVALDETIDEIVRSSANFTDASATVAQIADQSTGVAAIVLKPSVVGGLEATTTLARAAMSRGVRPVISSAFESNIGLNTCAHLAGFLEDALEREICAAKDTSTQNDNTERSGASESPKPLILELDNQPSAHGLGTATWFNGDVMSPNSAPVVKRSNGVTIEFTAVDAALSKATEFMSDFTNSTRAWGEPTTVRVETPNGCFGVHVVESQRSDVKQTIVLLHGFMGSSTDWDVVARGLAASGDARVVAIDLPAHGETTISPNPNKSMSDCLSIEEMRDVVAMVLSQIGCAPESTHVVGYSMGARVALALDEHLVKTIVSIGGSPGVRGDEARRARAARDDALASALRKGAGVREFAEVWYKQSLFTSLIEHPRLGGVEGLSARRGSTRGADAEILATCLSAASPGRQGEQWSGLGRFAGKLTLIVGEKDEKFKAMSFKMRDAVAETSALAEDAVSVLIVPDSGHAVHLEAPEAVVRRVLRAIRREKYR